jgi:hypothetical protein
VTAFAWHFFRCEIPDDWELLRYGLDPRIGELAFATRAGWQARFAWKAARTVSAPLEWQLLPGDQGQRFERGVPDLGLHLTWTFEGASPEEGASILASTRLWSGGDRQMTLHGIVASYPERFVPVKVAVHPANVMLVLEAPERNRRVWRRWGLPEAVLRGQTRREFLRRLLQAEGLRLEKMTTEDGADVIETSAPGLNPLARLLFRRARGRARIWTEDEGSRLCTCEELGHETVESAS